MKTFYVKHRSLCAGAFVSLLVVCSSVIHPFGRPKQSGSHKPFANELQIPAPVAAVLNRSCLDCHSNQTVWPWYSYVAPMSWLVERDVHRGRDHMNLSVWQQYTFKQKEECLADIATAVKNGEMPLRQYTLVHRRAKLSAAETDAVYGWAREERRRLKAAFNVSAQPTNIGTGTAPQLASHP